MTAGSLSGSSANGQQIDLIAGPAAINVGDLLEIGGPVNEAFTVATADYAASPGISTLGTSTVVAAALPGRTRQPIARDRMGNIYLVGTNNSGNLVAYKYSPLGTNLLASATLDATATSVNSPKLFQLQNGNFACVYARAAGALYFVVFDAALNVIAGPTSVATEYASTNVVHHDAWAVTGGGFAVAYQTSAGTAINLVTYTNAGAVSQAATNIQTLASSGAIEWIKGGQLSSGNFVVAFRGTMTAGGTAGTSFVIVTTAAANVAGPTNMDSTSTAGIVELSILTGFFAIASANGTNIKCGVYSNAGAVQGSVLSVADTLNSSTYPQTSLENDGVQFWLSYFGSAANGLYVVQIPTAGATSGVSAGPFGGSTLSASTYALATAIINGLIVALAADSSTAGQYWLTVGLPDASLGINVPYLRTAPTSIGTAAGTTGTNWPRVLSGGGGLYGGTTPPTGQPTNPPTNGDFTAIFAYDQQNTAATYLAVQKVEASAIVGVALSAVAANNAGSEVTANPGPGEYTCNPIAGTGAVSFNNLATQPAGASGVIFGAGVSLSGLSGLSGAGSASAAVSVSIGSNVVGAGFLGIFGSGKYEVFFNSGTFIVDESTSNIRVRVLGAGGGGCQAGSGGGGAGYALGVVKVSPGQQFTVTVGAGGTGGSSPTAGGASSFSTLLSATGGNPGNNTPTAGTGGAGTGGEYQASGGSSGAHAGSGGGGAGSQIGPGGNTLASSCGGGAPGSSLTSFSTNQGGASPFGPSGLTNITTGGAPDITGLVVTSSGPGTLNSINATIRFPGDGFTSGGGPANASGTGYAGGLHGGGGGFATSGIGGTGGYFAGAGGASGAAGGVGGLGGGGGGCSSANAGGAGGNGLVVVEF